MTFSEINIDKKRALLHVLFWTAWIISFTIIQSLGGGIQVYFMWLVYYIVTLPIFVAHTYLLAYWLIPKTFFRKKYFYTFLGIIAFWVVFSILELIISNTFVFQYFDPSRIHSEYLQPGNILISGVGNHFIILVFLAIKAVKTWSDAQSEQEELLQLKTETEMEIYHYQVQPRLILSLIEKLEITSKTKPNIIPDLIINLSGFLHQFLFEAKDESISLEQDVRLLKSFFAIHKQALGDRLINNIIVDGKLQAFVIQPLLLYPYFNRAINCAYQCNNSFESTVIIKAEKKYLLATFTFWSENPFSFADDFDDQMTRKRLDFNYNGKYRLLENIEDNFVEVSLEIFK